MTIYRISNAILLGLLFYGLCSCRKQPADRLLEGGYILSRYESAVDDKYYIMSPNQNIVIPSKVEKINVLSHWIYGYVYDLNVPAMPRMPIGFLLLT